MAKLVLTKNARDYILTFLVEIIIAFAGIYVLRLATTNLSEIGSSEYLVSKRILSSLQPFLILGLGVAIPRFVSMAMANKNIKQASSYFYAGIIIILFSITVLFISCFILKNQFAYLFFGDVKFAHLVMPLCLMVAGILIHSLSYGYYRGVFKMGMANALQLLNLGIVPIVVYYFYSDSLSVINATGSLWIGISLFSIIIQLWFSSLEKKQVFSATKEILNYGLQRVPGDFLLAMYFTLPVIFINHSDGLIVGGYISLALSFLGLAGAVFTPICLMLLTEASQMIVQKEFQKLKRQVLVILKITLSLTLAGILLVEIFAPFIFEQFLNVQQPAAVFATRITIIAAIGYTIFISLRSVLDAYYIRPINTLNIAISFGLFALISSIFILLSFNYIYILGSFVFSLILLGMLTFIETQKVINIKNTTN